MEGLKGISRWLQGRVVQEFEVKERLVDSSVRKETPLRPGWELGTGGETERGDRGSVQAGGGGGARDKFVHACANHRGSSAYLKRSPFCQALGTAGQKAEQQAGQYSGTAALAAGKGG